MTDRCFIRPGFTKSLVTLCMVIQLSACGGSEEEGQSAVAQNLGSVTVSWTAPTERTNGDALLLSEIRGYRVYYGLQTGQYPNRIEVNDSTAQQVTVNAERGFYFFVITTVDTAGRESEFSQELATTI